MASLSSTGLRFGAACVVCFGFASVAPMGCLSGGYTFNLTGSGGASSSSSGTTSTGTTTSTTGTAGGSTSTTSTSGGGATSSSTTSSTSTSGSTCTTNSCTDPNCADSLKCVPAAPTGWTGFYRLYDSTTSAPGCDATWPTTAYDGNAMIDAPPDTCNCTCGAASGEKCAVGGGADPNHAGYVDEITILDAACGGMVTCGGALEVLPTWNGACYGPDGYNAGATNCGPNSDTCTKSGSAPCNVSAQAAALTISGGSCTPTSTTPTAVPTKITWGEFGEACGGATVGTGCLTGETCLPIPAAQFVTGVCVMQTGNVACPAVFTDQHVFYDPSKTTDTRACSGTCTCAPPSGGSCSATITVYSDQTVDTCNTLVATLNPTTAKGDCQPLTGNPSVGSREATFSAVTGSSCVGTGGTATGTATPASATTFCCVP